MFRELKDSFASGVAKSMLASKIERYGKLTDLRIQSGEKSIQAELQLEGETEPVKISVTRYKIVKSADSHAIVVEAVDASRVWVKNLLEDFLVGKEIQVPPMALFALGKVEL